MKQFNKQILEAINKGIQLALDDLEDIEDNSSISSDIINPDDAIGDRVKITRQLVDLGLPSGTLWFNYNLGVDNKNAYKFTKPEEFYGDYYAWGEKCIKLYYDWDNYIYCKYPQRNERKLIKYCRDNLKQYWTAKGEPDNLDTLCPFDDVARHIYGQGYHIPTIDEYNELLRYTLTFRFNNYNGIKGLSGRLFKSVINEEYIFFPFNGIKSTYLYNHGEKYGECVLQTANLSKNPLYCKVFKFFNIDENNLMNMVFDYINIGLRRYLGMGIRPVYNPNIK